MTHHQYIWNIIIALPLHNHLKKNDPCRDFAANPGSRGMMITQGRFLEKQQTNALIFKMINPITQIKSKIEYSKQSNILFTHYEKFRIKQSSSSIIQTWANNEICAWEQKEISNTGQKAHVQEVDSRQINTIETKQTTVIFNHKNYQTV